MAFPQTGILDDFNRGDEGPPPSASWGDCSLFGLVVDGNEVVPDPLGGGNGGAYWLAATGADCEAYATMSQLISDGNSFIIAARAADNTFPAGGDTYLVIMNRLDAGDDYVTIEDPLSGVIAGPFTITLQAGDSIGIRCYGSTIEAWYKAIGGSWAMLGSAINSDYPGAGFIGLFMNDGAGDDFGGGNYIAPPTPGTASADTCVECARLGNPFAPPAELDWYISPDGQSYQFDNASDDILLAFQGYGMPTINYITQQGPFQHGETLLDYRLAPRIIQLEHRRESCDRYDYWSNRGGLLNLLRPNRQYANSFALGKLRKILPGNVKRDIDVLIQQGPQFAARNDGGDWIDFTDTIQFIAPDPTFYNPDIVTVTWAIVVSDELFFYSPAFPNDLFFPISFGTDILTGTASLHYTGTWLAYPTITITGPINQPIIENLTTGEKIHLLYHVVAGEIVTIALPFGNKTITSSFGTNLIGTVSTDSDLATFHIAPEPEAAWCGVHPRPCGVNNFSVSGGGGVAGTTAITMQFYTRYIGI